MFHPINTPQPPAAAAYVLKNASAIIAEERHAQEQLNLRSKQRKAAEQAEEDALARHQAAQQIADELHALRQEFQPECDQCHASATVQRTENPTDLCDDAPDIFCDECAAFDRARWQEDSEEATA